MINVPDSLASDLGSIPGQAYNFLSILFSWIHLIRQELWKNWDIIDCPIEFYLLLILSHMDKLV